MHLISEKSNKYRIILLRSANSRLRWTALCRSQRNESANRMDKYFSSTNANAELRLEILICRKLEQVFIYVEFLKIT